MRENIRRYGIAGGLAVATGLGFAAEKSFDYNKDKGTDEVEVQATQTSDQGMLTEVAPDNIFGNQESEYVPTEDKHFFDNDFVLKNVEDRIMGETGNLSAEERAKREAKAAEFKTKWCWLVGKFANHLQQDFARTPRAMQRSFASLTMDSENKEAIIGMVEKYAEIANIPPAILFEIIIIESQGNSFAKSNAVPPAEGIMQLSPAAAKGQGLNPAERDNNEQNIGADTGLLRGYVDRCYGALDLGIVMLNMGEANFKDMICRMYPNIEKKHYVSKIDKDGQKHLRFTFTPKGEEQFKKLVADGTINGVDIFYRNIEDQKNNEHNKKRRRYDTSYLLKIGGASNLAGRVFNQSTLR